MDLSNSMATTIESVRLALGAGSLRQRIIASNIANASSPDHVRMKVVFEEHLANALDALSDGSALQSVQPDVVAAGPRGAKVQIDQEMVDLSANSVRYQALTKGLSRYYGIASLIVSSGRG